MRFGKTKMIYQIYLSLMKYLTFFLELTFATVLQYLEDDWIVYFYKSVYYKVFCMACINYYI